MKNLIIKGLTSILLALPLAAFALPGQLDVTFTNLNLQAAANVLLPLPNGQVLVGFNNLSPVFYGTNFGSVLRLNGDGTLDSSFAVGDTNKYAINNFATLAGGNVLVDGSFTSWAGSNRRKLVKLDANGAVLTGFLTGVTNASKLFLAEQPDGKILLSGNGLKTTNGTALPAVAQLFPDGSRNTNFFATNTFTTVSAMDLVPDGTGRFFLAYYNNSLFKYQLVRCNADGTYDTNFATVNLDNLFTGLKALPNGGAVVAGYFSTYNSVYAPGNLTINHLIRLSPDGSLDSTFAFTDSRYPTALAVQLDGKVLVPNASGGADRFNADGSFDFGWTRYLVAYYPAANIISVDVSNRVLFAGQTLLPPTFTTTYGVYRLQDDSSFGAIPPYFTLPGSSQLVYPGDTFNWQINPVGPNPITVQWQFNSNNIANATNLMLTVPNCQATNGGYYRLVASNAFGSTASSNILLTVRLEPRILINPVATNVDAPDIAYFSVTATSTVPLVNYQWRFNGNPMLGATNNPLMISPVSSTNAGNYSVVVSNVYGAATSSPALLSVNSTLRFKVQPVTNLFLIGGTATNLSAVVAGDLPLSFQWFQNGLPLAGATTSSLGFNPIDRTNSGTYYLIVTNNSGSITSLVAKLTIFSRPQNSWVNTNPFTIGSLVTDMKLDGAFGVVLAGNGGVSRLDDDGSLRWFVPFLPYTNVVNYNFSSIACAVDGLGDTFVAAEFKGIASIGGLTATNPGTLTINNPGGRATLVVKLDITGQAQWIRYIDGGFNYVRLAADGGGGVVISGGHTGVLKFGNNSTAANPYASGVIARYTAEGNFAWVRDYQYYNTFGSVEIDAVLAQGTNIWVGGICNGGVQFGTLTASAFGGYNYWFGCLTTNGNERWVQTHSSGSQGLQLGTGSDSVLWAACHGPTGNMLARYSSAGVALTDITPSGSTGTASIGGMNVDSNNVGVVNGYFYATTTIGTNYFSQPSATPYFCYTGRYATNGTPQGAVTNGIAAGLNFQLFAANARGDVYVAGVPAAQFVSTNITGTNFYVVKLNSPVQVPQFSFQPIAAITNAYELNDVSLFASAVGETPLAYQWRKGGVPILGATNTTLTLISPLPADGGAYDCVVSNRWGLVVSRSSQVTILPPFNFTQQPKSAGIIFGTNEISGADILPTFITAGSLPGRTFHLHITNGINMWPTTANFTLNLPSANAYNIPAGDLGSHSGSWFVAAATPEFTDVRLFYWTTSPSNIMSTLSLSMGGHFSIHHDITDPAGCCAEGYYTIAPGGSSNVTFSVSFSGALLSDPNLSIQWFRNGVALPGQTNATLSYIPAGYPQAGVYTATFTYGSYSNTTAPATLNIYPPALGYTFVPGGSNMGFSIPPGYLLQSTATLAPLNWVTLSTNATYSVPLNQPGAYFRIVPQ